MRCPHSKRQESFEKASLVLHVVDGKVIVVKDRWGTYDIEVSKREAKKRLSDHVAATN